MNLYIVSKDNTKCLASCIFSQKNLEIFSTNNEYNNDQKSELEYCKLWIKYLYNSDYPIKYVGKLNNINPKYKFDIFINEETNTIIIDNNNNYNYTIKDFIEKNNIIINDLYTFHKDETEHSKFLYKYIKKYYKSIIIKYLKNSEMYYERSSHPVIIKFFDYHKIYRGVDSTYLEIEKEYKYVLDDF